jgi:transposase
VAATCRPGSAWRQAELLRRRGSLAAISKKGDVYLRRLLINGAQAVLNSKRAKTDRWIARLLQTKPRLLVAVALANKMARIAWAVMVRQTEYQTDFRRAPAAA